MQPKRGPASEAPPTRFSKKKEEIEKDRVTEKKKVIVYQARRVQAGGWNPRGRLRRSYKKDGSSGSTEKGAKAAKNRLLMLL